MSRAKTKQCTQTSSLNTQYNNIINKQYNDGMNRVTKRLHTSNLLIRTKGPLLSVGPLGSCVVVCLYQGMTVIHCQCKLLH